MGSGSRRLRLPKVFLIVSAVVVATATPLLLSSTAQAAPAASKGVTRTIHRSGTSVYHATKVGNNRYVRGSELSPALGAGAAGRVATRALGKASPVHRSEARSAQLSGGAGVPATSSSIVRTGPQLLRSFRGLNHRDQRTANNGNQYSLEPPDQGLCVGSGFVIETVNDAIRVYQRSGAPATGVEDLNTFLGYPPEVVRSIPVYGPFVTDPTCLFDPSTQQFFFTALTLGIDSATGNFTGQNQLDIAVTSDPTGRWTLYHLDVTDDGTSGTPVHPHCPCIGDYPHIGVDAHGFYITTNEYSFFGPQFNAAQIYAFSKTALASHASSVLVTQYDTTGAVGGNPGFTVWPAQSPVVSQYAAGNHGTEYFLSSNAAPEANGTGSSNRIVVWALTNTATVGTAHPAAHLTHGRVLVNTYTIPPPADQKPGATPLRACLNDPVCATFLNGETDPFAPEVIAPVDSNDTRMQQVTYAGGLLYGALDTGVSVDGATKAGIAYYVVKPTVTSGRVAGALQRQGNIALAGNNLIYPAIGITASGSGIVSFTLVGSDFFPSAAFTGFDAAHGPGAIQVAGAGVGPEDGFCGYKYYSCGGTGIARPRWGDYGATAVSGKTIWAAAEYIAQRCTLPSYVADYDPNLFGSCGGTRTALANWATRVSAIQP